MTSQRGHRVATSCVCLGGQAACSISGEHHEQTQRKRPAAKSAAKKSGLGKSDIGTSKLSGRSIAILATGGFEQSELTGPKRLLEEAGAKVSVIAPGGAKQIKGWDKKDWGRSVDVDVALSDADASDYDALVLPGGVMNPDKLRLEPAAITLIRAFGESGKPIAAICHGPWTLIDAELVKGSTMTSWPSLRTDLENAGATWEDREVVPRRSVDYQSQTR